ncbi:hypothetical protein HYZ64_00645 [Candidatus Berkelbacteria bacterium]|nr:hypothetical protein [Candidatus Berkelbacteria bacterium]
MTAVVLKNAPNNKISEGLVCLSNEGVTDSHWQRNVITDPLRRKNVAAALRGELGAPEVRFEDILAREVSVTGTFCKTADIEYPGDELIEKALRQKEAKAGSISVHDRFLPNDLHRRQLLLLSPKFGIKLYNNDSRQADCDGEKIPTKTGVFVLDYGTIFTPTDEKHRPFMLDYDDQDAWAREQGGDGLSTAEQTIYVGVIRPKMELGYLPYMGGSLRCRNACGSGRSLGVGFSADDGLSVSDCVRAYRYWSLGALPGKYLELGS